VINVGNKQVNQHVSNWTLIGTNFTKADIHVRGRFAITNAAMSEVYATAGNRGLKDFIAISTCNRTEFYGCAPLSLMKALVRDQLGVSDEQLKEYFYFETGEAAIYHFFRVAAGLDSQIIGDYEIVGQVKKAVQVSRQNGLTGTLSDRISSLAFQASKEIKAKTNLSQGKYSVSYAAAELINSHSSKLSIDRILVIGTGEMGRAVSRNLKEYFPQHRLAITNRTLNNAQRLATEIDADILPFETFTNQLNDFDVVVTTVQSEQFLIRSKDVPSHPCLFLDLSVPQVIDPQIKGLSHVAHYSVDEISSFHNELIKQRFLDIPKAEKIVEEYIAKLMDWQTVYKHRGVILNYKEKMARIIHNGGNPAPKIERSFSGLIQQIKLEGYRGCTVIQTVNDLLALEE
jgi:glutamyl-tRNA reductase